MTSEISVLMSITCQEYRYCDKIKRVNSLSNKDQCLDHFLFVVWILSQKFCHFFSRKIDSKSIPLLLQRSRLPCVEHLFLARANDCSPNSLRTNQIKGKRKGRPIRIENEALFSKWGIASLHFAASIGSLFVNAS